jgi:hypothetical protein
MAARIGALAAISAAKAGAENAAAAASAIINFFIFKFLTLSSPRDPTWGCARAPIPKIQ